jgi:hypothetical protein
MAWVAARDTAGEADMQHQTDTLPTAEAERGTINVLARDWEMRRQTDIFDLAHGVRASNWVGQLDARWPRRQQRKQHAQRQHSNAGCEVEKQLKHLFLELAVTGHQEPCVERRTSATKV